MKIVKFYQNSCNPCKMVDEFLQREGVVYTSINVEEQPGEAAKHMVMGVPVVLLKDGDQVLKRTVGYKPAELEEILEELEKFKKQEILETFSGEGLGFDLTGKVAFNTDVSD